MPALQSTRKDLQVYKQPFRLHSLHQNIKGPHWTVHSPPGSLTLCTKYPVRAQTSAPEATFLYLCGNGNIVFSDCILHRAGGSALALQKDTGAREAGTNYDSVCGGNGCREYDNRQRALNSAGAASQCAHSAGNPYDAVLIAFQQQAAWAADKGCPERVRLRYVGGCPWLCAVWKQT